VFSKTYCPITSAFLRYGTLLNNLIAGHILTNPLYCEILKLGSNLKAKRMNIQPYNLVVFHVAVDVNASVQIFAQVTL
jgi:hypothetical protein